MTFFTIVSVAPMRAAASHRSEMVSQLLFGELCECLESQGDFVLIKCRYDGYEGWVQRSQLAVIETGVRDSSMVVYSPEHAFAFVNDVKLGLSPGSELYLSAAGTGNVLTQTLNLEGNQVGYTTNRVKSVEYAGNDSTHRTIIRSAQSYLGTPYLWGGKSIWGIDCSGLVQMVYKMADIFMPRDAWQQAEGGDVVGFLQETVEGDLAFFDNEEGRITHVGILLNDHEILHASGVVRIDPIDGYGIVHRQSGNRTHNLRVIKRFF